MTTPDRTLQLIAETHTTLAPFIKRLASKPEVEGIVVLSGLARNGERITFDERSDIDLTMWIDTDMAFDEWSPDPRVTRRTLAHRLPGWLTNFTFQIPLSWGRVEVNAHQRLYAYDRDDRTRWDDAMREAHACTAEVVFDRSGHIRQLIDDKAVLSTDERDSRLLRLAARLYWDIDRVPMTMAERGDPAGGHHVLTAAFEQIIEVLYLLGHRCLPARKWRLDGLTRHGLATRAEMDSINDAMVIRKPDQTELERRAHTMAQLWSSITRRLPANIPTGEAAYLAYSATGSANRQLRTRTLADQVVVELGGVIEPDLYDLVNFLAPCSSSELADVADSDIVALPTDWQPVCRRLRVLAAQLVSPIGATP